MMLFSSPGPATARLGSTEMEENRVMQCTNLVNGWKVEEKCPGIVLRWQAWHLHESVRKTKG